MGRDRLEERERRVEMDLRGVVVVAAMEAERKDGEEGKKRWEMEKGELGREVGKREQIQNCPWPQEVDNKIFTTKYKLLLFS